MPRRDVMASARATSSLRPHRNAKSAAADRFECEGVPWRAPESPRVDLREFGAVDVDNLRIEDRFLLANHSQVGILRGTSG